MTLWIAEVCNHFKQAPSHYMRGLTMEGLRFDHMCYLQTVLARVSHTLSEYDGRGKLSDGEKKHRSRLTEIEKQLRNEIKSHG